MEMQYNFNRKFKLWAYTVSHLSLLLRSEMRYPDQEDFCEDTAYNIDIEFWGVTYINIPTNLCNIVIKEININELTYEIDENLLLDGIKIFEIKSKDNKYYIIADGILIGKNKWVNQDRIFNYNSNLEHNEILFCSN